MSKSFKRQDLFAERISERSTRDAEELRFSFGKSSLGLVLVASSDKGIVSVLINQTEQGLIEDLQHRFPLAHLVRENRDIENVVAQVIEFIDHPNRKFDLPLDMRGTEFQKRVWRAVQKIPVGTTSTYSEVASLIDSPKAIRAVGSACANSQFSMIIPCHRVLHKDGSLSRGSWGGERQRLMIDREIGMAPAALKKARRKKNP